MSIGKIVVLLMLLGFLQNCSSNSYKSNDDLDENLSITKSVEIQFIYPEKDRPFLVNYSKLEIKDMDSIKAYIYSHDSIFNMGETEIYSGNEKNVLRIEMNKVSNSISLFNNFQNPNKYADELKYSKLNSFEIQTSTGKFEIHKYKRVDSDDKWKGNLYFSYKYGFLFETHEQFAIQKIVKKHECISDNILKELIDELKKQL